MQRDPRASTAADPAQRGVESDPRRWPARSLASPQSLAQIELRTLANDSNGRQAGIGGAASHAPRVARSAVEQLT